MIPYWGYYLSMGDINLVPDACIIGLDERDTFTAQQIVDKRLQVWWSLGDTPACWDANEALALAHAREYFRNEKRDMDARGIEPFAMGFGDEWYLHLAGGDPGFVAAREILAATAHDQFRQRDVMRERIDKLITVAREVFPLPFTCTDTCWNDQRTINGAPVPPEFYCPPFQQCDVLLLDRYLAEGPVQVFETTAPWAPNEGLEQRRKFDVEIATFFHHARRFGKPLVMVGHAFFNGAVFPTPGQLRWFYDLAHAIPEVIGLIWFTFQPGFGLQTMPVQHVTVERMRRENYGFA